MVSEKVNKSVRICIIGAGACGLPAIKSCLEEDLEVVCFERTSEIGGLWNYRADSIDKNVATVMRSTVVNTSKEMMAFSDFPPPADFPNFMHNSLLNKYLYMYAEQFRLMPYVRLNTSVDTLEKTDGDRWLVTLNNGDQELFDGVMLCTGHHATPYMASLNGLENFQGRVLHSQQYRDYRGFENQTVLVVGIGNSALDVAVELSHISKKIPPSLLPQGGLPYDVVYFTRLLSLLQHVVPWSVMNDYLEHKMNIRMDHDIYGLRPRHRFLQQHPAVNDALPNLLASGLLSIKGDISSFSSSGVVFEDGKSMQIDTVIICTGYLISFPYLRPLDLIPIQNNQVSLYKYVFPPEHKGLAVIGLVQPIGSITPIAEMQVRWVARIFAKRIELASHKEMLVDIAAKKAAIGRRYFASQKHTIQVDYVNYMDELATLLGVHPPLFSLLFTDPLLLMRLLMGANYPYVYRIRGPHNWSGAIEAVEQAPIRVKVSLKQRQCRMKSHKRRGSVVEYVRYFSLKASTALFLLLLFTGFWAFCSGPNGIPFWHFFGQMFLFTSAVVFFLEYYNIQYDMSTII